MKIFFVTDVHGSNVCYRKFLNALRVYDVDVGILLGDLTGKVLVPLVEKAGGGWETSFMGHSVEVHSQEELDKLKKTIEMVGYYWVHQTPDQFREYKADPVKLECTVQPVDDGSPQGVDRPGRRAAGREQVQGIHGAGQRRPFRGRRRDQRLGGHRQRQRPGGHGRRARDDHLLLDQPHSVGHAPRETGRRAGADARGARRPGQEQVRGDL